ncbi:MAG: hypothetical protein ACFFDT_30530 [Candidatus Hodarchaeota archaeon]
MAEEPGPTDLAEELYRFLNVEDPGRAVAQALDMFAAYRDEGKEIEALEVARKAVALLDTHVSKLSSGREFKKAATQMIAAANIFRDVMKSDLDANKAYRRAADLLNQASEEHRIWDDLDGAAAAVAVSCLLDFLGDHFEVEEKIGAFEEKIKNKAVNPTVSTILKIPRGFATAIQYTNPDWFVWSRDTVYSILLLSPIAKPYESQINAAISYVNKKMSAQIKFPNLSPRLNMQRDLVFDEEFQVSLGLINDGKGLAKNVSFSIGLPEEIHLISGELTTSLENMNPTQDLEKTLTLVCRTVEGRSEIETQLTMTVTYEDILGSKQTLPFGPFPIQIRAFKRADETREKIQTATETLESKFEEIKAIECSKPVKSMFNTMEAVARTFLKASNTKVDVEEFERAETYLDATYTFLTELTSEFQDKIKPEVLLENEVKQLIMNTRETIDKLSTQVGETITKLAEIRQKLEDVQISPPQEPSEAEKAQDDYPPPPPPPPRDDLY